MFWCPPSDCTPKSRRGCVIKMHSTYSDLHCAHVAHTTRAAAPPSSIARLLRIDIHSTLDFSKYQSHLRTEMFANVHMQRTLCHLIWLSSMNERILKKNHTSIMDIYSSTFLHSLHCCCCCAVFSVRMFRGFVCLL